MPLLEPRHFVAVKRSPLGFEGEIAWHSICTAPDSMSRMLGIISVDTVPFDRNLLSAPSSLPSLANAYPDGWGAAVYDATEHAWRVERRAASSSVEESFASIAPRLRGAVLVAHVRARTLDGPTGVDTAPFHRGRWVFASESEADGERLFAYFLTRLDEGGVMDVASVSGVDAVVEKAVSDLVERGAGTSFLLSNGAILYGHRCGQPLHLVERDYGPKKIVLASEPLTDEPWSTLLDRTLLRCARLGDASLDVVVLRGSEPRTQPRNSDVELPFTD